MKKVFENENVVLFKNGDKIVGNVSKEEAYKALEKEGVEAIREMNFEKVVEMAALSTTVITNYEQREKELSQDPVEDDEVLSNLLQVVTEAYEENRLDELFTNMVLASKLNDESILSIMKEFTESQKG